MDCPWSKLWLFLIFHMWSKAAAVLEVSTVLWHKCRQARDSQSPALAVWARNPWLDRNLIVHFPVRTGKRLKHVRNLTQRWKILTKEDQWFHFRTFAGLLSATKLKVTHCVCCRSSRSTSLCSVVDHFSSEIWIWKYGAFAMLQRNLKGFWILKKRKTAFRETKARIVAQNKNQALIKQFSSAYISPTQNLVDTQSYQHSLSTVRHLWFSDLENWRNCIYKGEAKVFDSCKYSPSHRFLCFSIIFL